MDPDAPTDSLQPDVATRSPQNQPASGKDGAKDPERFYCPYPGCNRSFAELWRLKVHFRAPPDIRGSGKERGHGTELTHCPKCNKSLKPGKHQFTCRCSVGCSGSKTTARQLNKRSRSTNDAELADDAPSSNPPAKHVKSADLDAEPIAASWQDAAQALAAQTLQPLALQQSIKQEQQDWPPNMHPGILYAPNGTATAWLPGHVNGLVAPLQSGHGRPQYTTDLPFTGAAAAAYAQQLAAFPGLPGYPQHGLAAVADQGQVLTLHPAGPGHLQPLPGMPGVPQAPLPEVSAMLFSHPQPHDSSLLQPTQLANHLASQQAAALLNASALAPHLQTTHPASTAHQLPQGQPQGHQPAAGTHPAAQQHAVQADGGLGPAVGASGAGACDTLGVAPVSAVPSISTAAGAAAVPPPPPSPAAARRTISQNSFGSIFADVEEFTRDFGRIPSPPPLPDDFHAASSANAGGAGVGGSMLFNFAQFGQKLPRPQSQNRMDRNRSAMGMGLGLEAGLEEDFLYDHTDDGDLMQLLFGVPDELPTMATIHLHKWHNEEREEGGQGQQQVDGTAAAGQHAGRGLSAAAAAAGGAAGVVGSGDVGGSSNGGLAGAQREAPGQLQPKPQSQQEGGVAGLAGSNGEAGAAPGEQLHGQGVGAYLAHDTAAHPHGMGGSGKVVLTQLVNGVSNNEHHRDNLLDAETFQLLQSCD
ncbi:hypothetical protein Agub_g6273 [Astrephomene gubernaculifera]|uniref:Uncharacterized protein n=1 Tax=Astrephomene gubernaculifera TaxID=47775 RepID=A0AAD3DQP8_9CHLO|nr:hypothetical protein Agub_g6273 [Astrephomene gubernaculifera]